MNHYRAQLPARYLPGKLRKLDMTDLTRDWSKDREEPGAFGFPNQEGDTAVWMWPGNNTRALICHEMMQQGIRVIVEADDNYLLHSPISEVSEWRETYDGTDEHSFEIFARICRFVDALIVSTPRLAEAYSHLNSEIHVCPNVIDPSDWSEEPKHQTGDVLRVGWAASDSHRYDAALIRDALEWASRQPGVEVFIMGIEPALLRWRFPYKHARWTQALNKYRRDLEAIDVMLCPLLPGEWMDCKSDIKAVEAGMAGACSVVSKVEAYRPWWDGRAPGYVAENSWDFKRILKHLVRNRDEVRESARLAREYVLAERDIRDAVKLWREAIRVPVAA